MRTKTLLIIATLLLVVPLGGRSQQTARTETSVRYLRNSDVIQMVQRGMKSDVIIARIVSSQCRFDVFPAVMKEMKMRGVPDSVLQVMMSVPNGPASSANTITQTPKQITKVNLPSGTIIEVEAAYTVSSAELEVGDRISFLVARPVMVDGSLAISRNALATGRVVEVKKAQNWGKGGMLAWEMEEVIGIDGTKVPINVSGSSKGQNRLPTIAAGAAVTAALVFPYTTPVALIWAFKKGEDAKLYGSERFNAVVRTDTEVASLRPGNMTYFSDVATLKVKRVMDALGPMNQSFRPSESFLPSTSFRPTGSYGTTQR